MSAIAESGPEGPGPGDAPGRSAIDRADARDALETEARETREFRTTTRLLALLGWVVWAVLGATAPLPGGLLLGAAGVATALDLVVEVRSARSLRRIAALRSDLDARGGPGAGSI